MQNVVFISAASLLLILNSQGVTLIMPTSVTTTATNVGSNTSFPDVNDTIDGIINTVADTNGFVFNTLDDGIGVPNPDFIYTFSVPAGEALTAFDIFTVVGSLTAERVTTFDLVISNAGGTVLFSELGITEPSPVGIGGSITVDLSAANITGLGTFTATLTDQSAPLFNREFSEVQFTSTVPEPSSGLLGLLGISSLLTFRRRNS